MKKAIIVLLVVLVVLGSMPSFVAAVCDPCGTDPTFCDAGCPSSPPAGGCANLEPIVCLPFCDCPGGVGCTCVKETIVTYVPGFDISGVLYLFAMFTGVFLLIRMPRAKRILRRSSK